MRRIKRRKTKRRKPRAAPAETHLSRADKAAREAGFDPAAWTTRELRRVDAAMSRYDRLAREAADLAERQAMGGTSSDGEDVKRAPTQPEFDSRLTVDRDKLISVFLVADGRTIKLAGGRLYELTDWFGQTVERELDASDAHCRLCEQTFDACDCRRPEVVDG